MRRLTGALSLLLFTACSDELPTELTRPPGRWFSVVTPTYLGTLPGMANSQAYAVNASGQVAGYSYSFDAGQSANIGHGFIWAGGVFTDIGVPDGYNNSAAVDINDEGVLAGVANVGNTTTRAFIWDDGVYTIIPTLGGAWNAATDINNSGQVVGWSRNGANQQRAFIYSGGVVSELAPIAGSTQCIAYGINDAGVAVGSCIEGGHNHAVKWVGGVATALDFIAAGSHDAYAWAINAGGTIVGTDVDYTVNPHRDHAVTWQGTTLTDLPDYPGLNSAQAFGINSNGLVVGHASANSTTAPVRAVYWVNGFVDELGVPAGYAISSATDVNNAGVAAGFVETSSFVSTAVIWQVPDPPPAPATPTDVVAVGASRTRIGVSWTDASNSETQFEVQQRAYAGGDWGDWQTMATLAAGTTSYQALRLTESSTYQYRVRACNTGGCSTYGTSDPARTFPRPSAPTAFSGTAVGPGQIDLTWTESAAEETGFEISRSARNGDTWSAYLHVAHVPANTTTYSDTDVQGSTVYRYRIQECAFGVCSSHVLTSGILTPPVETSAPAAPSNLVANAISASRIDLSWTDNADNEWEFQVFRRQDLGGGTYSAWQRIDLLLDNTTTYRDELVSAAARYRYVLRACNPIGCSANALTGWVTTPASIGAR